MKKIVVLVIFLLALSGCQKVVDNKDSSKTTSSSSYSEKQIQAKITKESQEEKMKTYPAESLLKAVETKDLNEVKAILKDKTYKIDEQNDQGETPLLIATHDNQVDIAKALINAGADVNIQDHIQDSPFLYAGAQGRTEILKYMLENAKPDQKVYNRYGGNTLIPAAEKGHLETVKVLLADGSVDIDHQNKFGYTALIEAVALRDGSKVYQDIVKELLQYGANKTLRDNDGKTAADYARELGYVELQKILKD